MATKKSKSIKSKKKLKKKISDKDLMKLQKELKESRGKSILIEKDLKELRSKLGLKTPIETEPKKKPYIFYRNFVFKCGKCVDEFEHTAKITAMDYKVVCPNCREEHILKIKPLAGKYDVKFPRSIKLIK